MAQFYVSHAYEDRGFANTLIAWLAEHAFSPGLSNFVSTPKFTDNRNHPTQAVKAIQESDAVVMLCSQAWGECKQCYAEYVAAQASGKFLVALIIKKPDRDLTLAPDIPRFVVDNVGRELTNLVSVLSAFERADPYCYDWTPHTLPYPGVRTFEPAEAGVFFARDTDIQNVVARISAQLVGETNGLTLLVGPTGSGVSSLLSAGVLPALARNATDNFILPVIRPRLRPVDSLAVSIATALGAADNWRRWSDRLTRAISDDLAGFVAQCVEELRAHIGNPDARILVPIDQLEELFEVSDPVQARSFEAFIAVVSASDLPVYVISTLGSQHLKTFQNSRLGVCNRKSIAIEPIPLERYGDLIRGPAQRAGVLVEDALVERLVADAAEITEDRLSLVAALLRLFWRLESPFGQFSEALYERLSTGDPGMSTLESAIAIEAELAVEDANTTFESRKTVGRALVELAVRWDVNSRPVRTPFALEEIPRDKIDIVDRLQDAGFVSKVQVGDQHLAEISSLALFRRWPRLERLLKAQSEGPEIVLSHCREVSCVASPDEKERATRNHPWKVSASILGESLTASLCVLAVLAVIGPYRQDNILEKPASQSIEKIETATPIKVQPPAPLGLYRDENENLVIQAVNDEAVTPAKDETAVPSKGETAAPAKDEAAAHQSHRGPSQLADASEPAILPTKLLPGIIRLKFPNASRADLPEQASENDLDRPSTAQLPELLDIIHMQPSSNRQTTHMLLALEALLHPKASLLTGQQRSKLRQLIRQNLKRSFGPRSFRIHDGKLFAATFSPDGKQIASASKDGIARLWNADSGDEIHAFEGHGAEIYGVAYSRDGSKLITTSRDQTGRIWNTDSRGKSVVLRGHKGAVYRAGFDADGDRVVTASQDGKAIIWDVNSGKQLKVLRGHRGAVWSVSFSRDGQKILSTSKDKTARIWRSDTGQLVTTLEGHKADVVTGVFSPDGRKVATGSRDGSVLIWNSHTGQETANLLGHTGTVFSTQFSDDGLFLVTASFDGTAKIWELATGQIIADLKADHSEMRDAGLAPDGRFLRTVSGDGKVSIWPVALTPDALLDNVLKATNGCLSAAERRALNLTADIPWWCRLSSRSSHFDVARTGQ